MLGVCPYLFCAADLSPRLQKRYGHTPRLAYFVIQRLIYMKENKKIIIATGIFPPDIGGPATYSEKLAQELKKRNFDVQIITYSDPGVKYKNYNFPLTTVSRRYPQGVRHFLYFWRLLKIAKDFDVIYAQCPVSSGLPACFVAKILNKKFILKIVGDYAWEQAKVNYGIRESIETFQNRKDYPLKIKVLRFLEKWVAKNVKQIITPSNYLKDIVSKWGIEADKIKIIYNSIDDLSFEHDLTKEEAQNKIGIKGDILLSIGRLVPWKGFNSLIKIMPDLLAKNIRFKLIIIGSGPERERLKDLIENLNLKNYVFLIGQVKYSEIVYYFRATDLFILNTAYEGLSHVLLEAMQFEVPIITTFIGGNPEIIEHNYNGLLIEYDNRKGFKKAIWGLWQDKELQKKFIENSKKVLEKFTFKKMIKESLEILVK